MLCIPSCSILPVFISAKWVAKLRKKQDLKKEPLNALPVCRLITAPVQEIISNAAFTVVEHKNVY
jgi:hypothetical protein